MVVSNTIEARSWSTTTPNMVTLALMNGVLRIDSTAPGPPVRLWGTSW